jgi:hypothetical protein
MSPKLQDKNEKKNKNFKMAATSGLAVLSIYIDRYASWWKLFLRKSALNDIVQKKKMKGEIQDGSHFRFGKFNLKSPRLYILES